jgi:hypothetical protein
MTTDTDMKIDYVVVLKDLQQQLDGIDERRQALQASIAAIKRLVGAEGQVRMVFGSDGSSGGGDERRPASIPPGFFASKTPTDAYRDLKKLWPGDYTAPRIVDAFIQGGMKGKTRTQLLQAVHSVLKRERDKAKRNGNGAD